MKRVHTEDLKEGMKTGAPVITRSGQLIINMGIELDQKLIDRIDFYGIPYIEVDLPTEAEPAVKAAPVSELPKPEPPKALASQAPEKQPERKYASYSQKVKQSAKFQQFQISYSRKIGTVQDSLKRVISSDHANLDELVNDTVSLIDENHLSTLELFDMLHNSRQIDDTVYAHSLNVSLISRVLAKWLKFSQADIDAITLAGLLHDIGKTQIPSPILNKPGKLTAEEFAIIKMHPKLGYDMVKDKDMDPRIKQAVLMHHERCDGSGYPLGISGDRIDDFSKIIAIADVYDAMTAARSYRGPLCPFQVIASFEEDGLQKYQPHFILTFLERIANTYQNNRVLLSDGRSATIILLNSSHLSRPTLRLKDGSFLDLSQHHDISIVSVI